EPEVLTGHTEVICSTSIERIVTGRNAALAQIESIIHQLEDISSITNSIGGGVARDWAMRQDFRCGCWLMEKVETAMPVITRNLDRYLWQDLMKKSGMLIVMDAQARDQWYRNLES
ncbi:restriction endonuclease subunit M, partial [Serratia fonticola]